MENKGYIARLTLTLFAITFVVSALLGLVNAVTKEPIAEANAQKTRDAMAAVLTFDDYAPIDFADESGLVTDLWQATAGGEVCGYVAQVTPSGFGGALTLIVGVDADGACTGVSIVSHSETSGLGANAAAKTSVGESFRGQFTGASGQLAVTKDGGSIDALTGATVTSRAVTKGVNAALACVAALEG